MQVLIRSRNTNAKSVIYGSHLTSVPEHQNRWKYERRTLSGGLQGHRAKRN